MTEKSDAPTQPLTLTGFLRAHAELRRHFPPTPLTGPHAVDPVNGVPATRVFAKHEQLAVGGSFKCRGAIYRLSLLSTAERAAGVVTSSTGNHGIAVAIAAEVFGTNASVVVPEDAADVKVDKVRRLKAKVRRAGSNLSEATAAARELEKKEGRIYIDDGNDADVALGAGTIALEILLDTPDIDVIMVPVGGGNLIAGVAACAKAINPAVQIIGVQSAVAPAVHDSWHAGYIIERECATFAGGLATERPGRLAFTLMQRTVDDMLLVSDEQLLTAMTVAEDKLAAQLEGAGAASIAGVLAHPDRWRDQRVVVVLTGGNV